MTAESGRAFEPRLTAELRRDGALLRVLSPTVGTWRGAPPPGALIRPGFDLGQIEVLGILHRVLAPAGAVGVVTVDGSARSPGTVEYGTCLVALDPDAATAAAAEARAAEAQATEGLAFRSPLSGRFYLRPSPDQPPFVAAGATITTGQTVALLEVMKTFNRITYGGDGLPDTAVIAAVVPENEDDLEQGDVILRLESPTSAG